VSLVLKYGECQFARDATLGCAQNSSTSSRPHSTSERTMPLTLYTMRGIPNPDQITFYATEAGCLGELQEVCPPAPPDGLL